MSRLAPWLFAFAVLFASAHARADAHSNCQNQCTIGQIQCTRPIVMRGGVDVSSCNARYSACLSSCPPASPPSPPAGSPPTLGVAGSANTQTIAPFPGTDAPLPPAADTSSIAADQDAAEQERIRQQANFEAVQTNIAMNLRREQIIDQNKVLAALGERLGLDMHLTDPPPIPPPILVPPAPRRNRACRGGGCAVTKPGAAPWPQAFSMEEAKQPDLGKCRPKPPIGSTKWRVLGNIGGAQLEYLITEGVAVKENCEDETVRLRLVVKDPIGVQFTVRITSTDGETYIGHGQGNFTNKGTWEQWSYDPFIPTMTDPHPVGRIEILEVWSVDINQAYQTWNLQNPPAGSYFAAWQYRVKGGDLSAGR